MPEHGASAKIQTSGEARYSLLPPVLDCESFCKVVLRDVVRAQLGGNLEVRHWRLTWRRVRVDALLVDSSRAPDEVLESPKMNDSSMVRGASS